LNEDSSKSWPDKTGAANDDSGTENRTAEAQNEDDLPF
jgi:hypothetical protein